MQLTITINCGNDAFIGQGQAPNEVGRILEDYAAKIRDRGEVFEKNLLDLNGSAVGEVTILHLDIPHHTELLAKAFCRRLWAINNWDEMELAIEENAEDPDKDICHTHDICDANMVMLDAWNHLRAAGLVLEHDCADPDHMRLWNAGWEMARNADFRLEGYQDGFLND
jgi:hypothetical protein